MTKSHKHFEAYVVTATVLTSVLVIELARNIIKSVRWPERNWRFEKELSPHLSYDEQVSLGVLSYHAQLLCDRWSLVSVKHTTIALTSKQPKAAVPGYCLDHKRCFTVQGSRSKVLGRLRDPFKQRNDTAFDREGENPRRRLQCYGNRPGLMLYRTEI